MSEDGAEDQALSRLLDRLTRPGMVDVGSIRSDFDRLSAPGLGLGNSATTQRIAARGGDAAVPVVSGDMVHAASADAAGEPAPSEATVGSVPAMPPEQQAALGKAPSRIAATVQAAASLGAPGAVSPVAAVPAQPQTPAAQLAAALELVAPLSSGPSPEPAASAEAAVAGGAAAPVVTATASPPIIVARPANDIAAEAPEPMVIDRTSAPQPADASATAQSGTRYAAPVLAGAAPQPIPAMALSGAGAVTATAATAVAAPATAVRAPDIAAIAERVRHELLRDLAVEAERRGGQRWRR